MRPFDIARAANLVGSIRYCQILASAYERRAAAAAGGERRRYLRLAAAERRAMARFGRRLIGETIQPLPAMAAAPMEASHV
jgi:hypothetical protein